MSGASLVFDLIAKDHASDKLDKVGSSADKSSGKLKTFAKVGAAGFAAIGAGAVAGSLYVFNHAAKLEQMDAKAQTVFGGQIGLVDKWASKNAHAMGLTTTEATGLAANFADLLIPMGFTREAAAKMSTDVVGLSGALSQWSGGTKSAAEVTDILNSAMLGETDGLKALGISISAADVSAELLRKGQDKLTGSAQQQAEAQAIQALILAKSTDAQAAFAAGGSPLLSAQNKLKATFGEMRDQLVSKLVPALSEMGTWFVDKGLPAIKKFGGWLADKFGPIIGKLVSWFKDDMLPALKSAYEGAIPALKSAFESVQKALKSAQPGFEFLGKFFVGVLLPVFGKVAKIVLPLMGKGLELLGKAFGALGKVATWLWNTILQPVFSFLAKAIGTALELFGDMLDALSHVPGFGWAKTAANNLHSAADQANGLADAIRKIPDKTVRVNVEYRGHMTGEHANLGANAGSPYLQTGLIP